MSADREMSETTSPAPEGAQEARTPDEIREDIESTREELGDTVEALAAKTDVKAQARQRVEEVKDNVQAKRDEFASRARESTPDSAQQGAQRVVARVRENPAPVVVGAAVLLGIVIGRLTSGR